MRSLRTTILLVCTALTLSLSVRATHAQVVPRWEVASHAEMQFRYTSGRLIARGSHHLVNIGESTKTDFTHIVRTTSDNGTTWKTIYSEPVFGSNWRNIEHPDANTYVIGIDSSKVVAQDANGLAETSYNGGLLISHNGSDWTHISFDSNTYVMDISMRTANDGAAVLWHVGNVNNPAPNRQKADLLITTDGWNTWSTHPISTGVGSTLRIFTPTEHTYVVATTGATNERLYRTEDDGVTWTSLGLVYGSSAITFINDHTGWAASQVHNGDNEDDVILKTIDGGVTWTECYRAKSLPYSTSNIESISFSDSLHGVAVGPFMLQTSDGGASWSKATPPFGVYGNGFGFMQSATMVDSAVAVALLDRSVLRTVGAWQLASPIFYPHELGPIAIAPTTIAWTPVHGATKYELQLAIYRPGSSANTAFNVIEHDTVVSDTSCIITDLLAGTTYYGRVRALSSSDSSDWRQSGDWIQLVALFLTSSRPDLPGPPRILTPSNGTTVPSTVTLVWASTPGALFYELELKLDRFGTWVRYTTTDTVMTVQDLQDYSLYYVRIRAVLASDTTDWSLGEDYFSTSELGVRDAAARQSIKAYPNPARDHVLLTGTSDVSSSPTIYDMLSRAQPVQAVKRDGGWDLDVRQLPDGVYTIVSNGAMIKVVVGR